MTVFETAGISVSFLRKPSTTAVTSDISRGAVELEVVGGQADVGALDLQDVNEPMRQLDIAVAGTLGLAQRLEEGFVADPVELAGDGLETDVGHRLPPFSSLWMRSRLRLIRSAG